jgi:hypothetical protein
MKKRALLIVTGTVGALGGVFAITPPQFGNNATGIDQSTTPSPVPSKAGGTTAVPAPSSASSVAPKPSQAPTKAPTTGTITVTGDTFGANEGGRNWGNVTVTVTFVDGVISSVKGKQSPTSRGQWAFNQLDPYVIGQKITVAGIKSKSANSLAFVSGVSYSSMAYWESLKSAITKAGL